MSVVQKAIAYRDRKNAYIVVKKINNPYGPGSGSVISIGSTLKGDIENPTWKVHIPVELASAVVQAIGDITLTHIDFESLSEDECL
tara:strand:- start:59 stop:316 length:258 start_codon:yes stop_codon:yes gene_type:complete